MASLKRCKINGWWQQMITVAYEQARGLRVKYQRPDWFEISVSRTISVPVAETFRAWEDPKTRSRWLVKKAVDIRKSIPSKSIRLNWTDKKTSLDLNFYPKGNAKSLIVV